MGWRARSTVKKKETRDGASGYGELQVDGSPKASYSEPEAVIGFARKV